MDGSPIKLKGLHRAATRSDGDPITSSQPQDAAPAICRICRGEGTAEEPLFYPCKCSGSIKYVHQDCLMEWLSHSQKKYCELCKTPFRFTKLYAPDMPQSLPVHVVIGHMAKYLFRNVLVWLRASLALSVWLCWLPYFMRSVWSFMFWVSDEGLGSSSVTPPVQESTATYSLPWATLEPDTCPATPLAAPTMTPVYILETLFHKLTTESLADNLVNYIVSCITTMLERSASSEGQNSTTIDIGLTKANHSSLLGEVAFLNNLTRNPTVNRAVISVLEGQIITVLVIICFILVILVRDYVVQQQPEINMRAAFAGPENPLQAPAQLDVQAQPRDDLRGPDESDDETLDNGEQLHAPTEAVVQTDATELAATLEPATSSPHETDTQVLPVADSGLASLSTAHQPPGELEALAQLPQQQRVEERASVYDYLRIYRRADGDPEKILRIVKEEGLEDRLAYWVDVTRRSIGIPLENLDDDELAQTVSAESHAEGSDTAEASSPVRILTPTSSDEASTGLHQGSPLDKTKGKEKEWWPTPESSTQSPGASFSPARPRSVSDGPQVHDSVNPLANNSWSWDALTESGSSSLQPNSSDAPQPGKEPEFDAETGTPNQVEGADNPGARRAPNRRRGETTPIDEEEEAPPINQVQGEHDDATQAIEPVDGEATGFVNRVTDFMWGDLEDQHAIPPAEDAEVDAQDDDGWEDIHAEDPDDDGDTDSDIDEMEALDPEAIDDLEDFEGVMELVGMRGPVAGLFQNAVFCAVLVSVTIFACIFLPYNIGRVSVWVLAHPMRLVRLLFELSKLLQDATILGTGFFSWCALNIVDIFTAFVGGGIAAQVVAARKASWTVWTKAGSKVVECIFMDFPLSTSEMQNFSAVSHGALVSVKAHIAALFSLIGDATGLLSGGFSLIKKVSPDVIVSACKASWASVLGFSSLLMNPSTWVIDLGEPERAPVINPELAYWSGLDRFWAILAGYFTLFMIGALYLKRGSPFSRGNVMQAWEAGIIDTLHQASGIMKVIMIISIEMLIFPLYCGLLLDVALLPLFANATFKSRMLFTYNFPMTSVFVHWFVGTGYMFHFALFVSMCRKIMRPGVLYFIRDPDDPEFHPVRDVLERNLTTQLRKILFSAMVYGALVIVCLGGVVWGLSYTLPNVLPIHYSSNEPVLEFPVDLLFYNFLMPLAVNFFKPSDALHAMYTWWFRKCARGLRLTSFLFGERRIDEEGNLVLAEESPHRKLPWYSTLFLELDKQNSSVIPKTWADTFEGGNAKPSPPLSRDEWTVLRHKKAHLRGSGQLTVSGRFVRAPASDRVKIPKGKKVFLDVNERGRRKDNQPDNDIYSTEQYQVVYVPPNFRTRVFLFILFIWMFAAITGVGFTIIPLTFGRRIFKQLIPTHIKTNDIYAFSIGIYLLGTLAYSMFHVRSLMGKVRKWIGSARNNVADGDAHRRVTTAVLHGLKLFYAYFFLLVVFPLLVSAMMELYMIIPLHTYMYPPSAASVNGSGVDVPEVSRHTVRVIQAWTLGLLYMKLGSKIVTFIFADTRLAAAIRTVLRRGWLHPDVGVLTRAFVLPGIAISATALLGPPTLTSLLFKYNFFEGPQPGVKEATEAARIAIIYRQSYPVVATAALLIRHILGLIKIFRGWTSRVRDEAYLIGERLHNFGAVAAGARRVRGAWRAGGDRL